jgi:hypothetical protein
LITKAKSSSPGGNGSRVALSAAAASVLLMTFGGCSGLSTTSPKDFKRSSTDLSLSTLPWRVSAVKGPRAVLIGVGVGSCGGGSKARIVRARRRYAGRNIYIRAEVGFPNVKRPKGVACGGVGLSIYKTVRVARNLQESKL